MDKMKSAMIMAVRFIFFRNSLRIWRREKSTAGTMQERWWL